MSKIKWEKRYSHTNEPDDKGRWARIGWINHKTDKHKPIQIAGI